MTKLNQKNIVKVDPPPLKAGLPYPVFHSMTCASIIVIMGSEPKIRSSISHNVRFKGMNGTPSIIGVTLTPHINTTTLKKRIV